MPEIQRIGEIGESAQQVVDQELETVEGGVDNAIDSTKDAVHNLRNEAEDIIDRVFGRVKEPLARSAAQGGEVHRLTSLARTRGISAGPLLNSRTSGESRIEASKPEGRETTNILQ
jgi:hypothetical protein